MEQRAKVAQFTLAVVIGLLEFISNNSTVTDSGIVSMHIIHCMFSCTFVSSTRTDFRCTWFIQLNLT